MTHIGVIRNKWNYVKLLAFIRCLALVSSQPHPLSSLWCQNSQNRIKSVFTAKTVFITYISCNLISGNEEGDKDRLWTMTLEWHHRLKHPDSVKGRYAPCLGTRVSQRALCTQETDSRALCPPHPLPPLAQWPKNSLESYTGRNSLPTQKNIILFYFCSTRSRGCLHPWRKPNSPSPRSQQLPITPQLGVGFHKPLPDQ